MKTVVVITFIFGMMLLSFNLDAAPVDGGIHLLISSPMGEMAEVSKTGMGLGGKFLAGFEMQPWFAIRGDIGYLSYDSKQYLVNFGGYAVYETVRREGFQLAIGPQLTYNKDSFKLYLSPMAGYYYFQTVISLPEVAYYYGYMASDTKDSYGVFGWTVGGGFMFDIGLGPWIDVGIKYNYLFDGARRKIENEVIKNDGSDLTISLGVVFYSNVQ